MSYLKNQDNIIRYSQCWEDTELMLNALDSKSDDIVVSITSGGCNALAICASGVEKLYAIDDNPGQNFLLEIKKKAFQKFDYHTLLEFVGIKNSTRRLELFYELSPVLSEDCRTYWNANLSYIKKGIQHIGKFEKYLNLFRKIVLPLIHSKKRIDQLLSITDKIVQEKFFQNVWNNRRWVLIFKAFFSEKVMKKRGRSEAMFHHNENKSIGEIYYLRSARALSKGRIASNRYMEYIFKGNHIATLPYYLDKTYKDKIKSFDGLEIVNNDLLSFLKKMPDDSISKFNLSDVFEPQSGEETQEVFMEIYRTAKKDARIIFWNNLVKRDVPKDLEKSFQYEKELVERLIPQEKIFFYECFKIYTILK